MESTKKSIESSTAKSMFSVVEQMNAGYEKFFDSKPKTSGVRSECYSNFMSSGSASKSNPEMCPEEGIPEKLDVAQQFFPENDEAKQQEDVKVVVGSGCCKYVVKKEK